MRLIENVRSYNEVLVDITKKNYTDPGKFFEENKETIIEALVVANIKVPDKNCGCPYQICGDKPLCQ